MRKRVVSGKNVEMVRYKIQYCVLVCNVFYGKFNINYIFFKTVLSNFGQGNMVKSYHTSSNKIFVRFFESGLFGENKLLSQRPSISNLSGFRFFR